MRLDHGQRVARERPPFDLASDQLIKTISAHADFTSLVSEDGELRESDTCSSLALLTTPPARLAQRMRRRGARTRRVVYVFKYLLLYKDSEVFERKQDQKDAVEYKNTKNV